MDFLGDACFADTKKIIGKKKIFTKDGSKEFFIPVITQATLQHMFQTLLTNFLKLRNFLYLENLKLIL